MTGAVVERDRLETLLQFLQQILKTLFAMPCQTPQGVSDRVFQACPTLKIPSKSWHTIMWY